MKRHNPCINKMLSLLVAATLTVGLFPTSAIALPDGEDSGSDAVVQTENATAPAASEGGGSQSSEQEVLAEGSGSDSAEAQPAQDDSAEAADDAASVQDDSSATATQAEKPSVKTGESESGSASSKKSRDSKEFSIASQLKSFSLVATDSDGEHSISWKTGESTDLDLGKIARDSKLSVKLSFSPNKAAGNNDKNGNPIVDGDAFTMSVPSALANAAGGKLEGKLQNSSSEYGKANGRIGTFTIENGKLSIKFDKGYVEETKGAIDNADLSINCVFNTKEWGKASFDQTLVFGSLNVKAAFPEDSDGSSASEPNSKLAAVQALIDALPEDVSDPDAVADQMDVIDEAMEELTSDELDQLDMTRYNAALKALGSEEQSTLEGDASGVMPAAARDAKEWPIDDELQELKLTITDSNGDHEVDWKQGDSTDIDLGTIDRNAQLSIKLVFDPNEVTGNDKDNSNPTVYGDTFTCTVPDILSNANGGKWEGVLKDQTTNYGIANDRVGEFTIENGKLTIKFDEGYVEETAGNIKNASLAFNGAFDSYGWDESSFDKTLYFGGLPIKVTFPAETATRNITVEKAVERYGKSDFSSSYGSQGKTALNGSPKVDADGYVSYSIKAKADDGNNVPLENVIISDTFTTGNVDLSTITLTSVVRTAGATDTDITSSAVEQKSGDVITGWNVGALNNGEEVLLTFKVKIDKNAITADVDAAKQANSSTAATDERSLKNTASVSADKTPAVTADETATLQNYMNVRKSTGSYDADADRQLFTITVTAPSDNKYTQTNVSVRDAPQVPNSAKPYVKDAGIQSITIVRADGTTETGTQDNPLYNNFSFDKGATKWQAFIDKMAPGDVATITAYMDFDEGIFTELGSVTSTSGYSGIQNFAYICDLGMNGDLSTAYHFSNFSVNKTWITKSAASITSDGIIRWTATGNSYSSLYPQANCAGMKVKDDLESNLEFVDDHVLVKFSRYDAATKQYRDVAYTGDDAENGYLKVPVNGTSFEFNVPDGYGDCRFTIAYDTKVTNNFGPAAYYYNNIGLDKWKYRASTYRPRIATMEKSQVVHGTDWTDWQTKVFGPVSTNDSYTDTITGNTDVMYMTDEQIAGIKLTFNGAQVDADLYTVEPTVIASGKNAGKYSGYKITFSGPVQSTDDAGKTITPSKDNPLYIDYRTQTELPVPAEGEIGTFYKYENKGVISVGGNEDTDSDFYWRANQNDITKKLKSFNGSSPVWTVTVNRYGESSVPTKEGCDNYNMPNGTLYSTDNTVTFTETLPAGLRFVSAKVGNSKGTDYGSDSKAVPTVEVLDQVQNADGTSTVTLRVNKVTHYECNKSNYPTSPYSSWHNYVWVNVDIETQIVDKAFLLDTANQEFQWTNTASVVTRDGIPFSASADVSAQHIAMSKEMTYGAGTAPFAQFTINANEDKCDLNPDGDTVKIFDKSSATLAVDTGSIKVVNATTKEPVSFLLDAGQMASEGIFTLEVPDNIPLKITYNAYVSGVTGEEVSVSNVAYFEGADIDQSESSINENVMVLNSEAAAESDVMVWLKKMSASGALLGDCMYQLDEYRDGAWSVKTPEIVTASTGAGTKVGGLDKNVLYRLTEIEAADNYVLDGTPIYFCLKTAQDATVAMPDDIDTSKIFFCKVAAFVNAYNNPYVDVKFSKTGLDQVVAGADFEVQDADGNVVTDKDGNEVKFTSGEEAELRKLAPGSYKLVETSAPAGFLVASPIDFVVNADETVSVGGKRVENNTVVCDEAATSVLIRKMARSAAGSLEPLAGAKLQIKDGDTVVVDTWETTEDVKEITGVLEMGKTYTIHEVEAPTGYLLADDIEFTINDDGTVDALTDRGKHGEIFMVDDKPSIDIKKVDADTNAQLGGVTLTLKKGEEVIRTWTTSATSVEQFDNLEVGATYTVSEGETLPGYTKISDFTFTPNADGTFAVMGNAASYGPADPADLGNPGGIPDLGIGVLPRDCGVLTVKNTYTPTPVGVTLSASKLITGADRPAEKAFTFELKSEDGTNMDQKSVTGEGSVDFAALTFSKGGTYNYTISEVAGSEKGYTYSAVEHAVEVTVDDDGEGTLTPTVKIDGVEATTAEFTNTYTPEKTNLSIPVAKVFSEDSAARPTHEPFSFTIASEGGAPLPAETTVTASEDAAAAFDSIEYTAAGTYTYTITEVDEGKAGYTYAEPKTVTVDVVDSGGSLAATWSIDGVDRATAVFQNSYAVTPTSVALPVKKTIDGDGWDSNTAFEFTLTAVGDAPMPADQSSVSVKGEGEASFGSITFDVPGTYAYKAAEVAGDAEGFTYDGTIYDIVVTVVDAGGRLEASWTANGEKADAITFKNTFTPVDSGDGVEKTPKNPTTKALSTSKAAASKLSKTGDYLAVGAVALGVIAVIALAVALVVKRRKKLE